MKKLVFYEMLEAAGRVFIIVKYSDNVMVGTRGFTEDEKRSGIVLVFNKTMNFSWDDSGINATLVFGSIPQKCFVPADDIIMVYSPELNSQFIAAPQNKAGTQVKKEAELAPDISVINNSNVVKIDFRKKKDGSQHKAKD